MVLTGKLVLLVSNQRRQKPVTVIHRGDALEGEDAVFAVRAFKEKPGRELAQQYCDSGEYDWNSGMFCFKQKPCWLNCVVFVRTLCRCVSARSKVVIWIWVLLNTQKMCLALALKARLISGDGENRSGVGGVVTRVLE